MQGRHSKLDYMRVSKATAGSINMTAWIRWVEHRGGQARRERKENRVQNAQRSQASRNLEEASKRYLAALASTGLKQETKVGRKVQLGA